MKLRIPKFQISLRVFLIVFSVVTAVTGYLVNRVVMERIAEAKLEKSGFLLAWSRDYQAAAGFHGALFYEPGLEQSNAKKTLRGKLQWELFRHVQSGFAHRGFSPLSDVSDSRLQPFEYLHHVESLEIGGQPVTDAGMKHLRHLRSLKSLGLCGTEVGDEGLKELTGLSNLEYIGLEGTNVTDAGLEHLAKLPRLVDIAMMSCKVEGPGLKHLAGLADLEDLSLASMPIHSKDLEPLANLKKLRHLHLSNSKIDDQAGDTIGQLTSLETLWIDETDIGDDFIAKIANLKNLVYLNIDDTRVSGASEKILSGFSKLENFYSYGTSIDGETEERIRAAIHHSRKGQETDQSGS